MRQLRGEVAQASVYALLKSDQVKRVDLQTLSGVLSALRAITGRDLHVSDLLEEAQETALTSILQSSRPVAWNELVQRAGHFTDEERQQDEDYWLSRRRERESTIRHEQGKLLR